MSHPKKPNRFRTLRLECLQTRDLMAVDFAGLLRSGDLPTYSIDGTANNASNLEWGSTNEKFLRLARSEYADGVQSVAGATAPSARAISNALADQGSQDTVSNKNLSAFVYAWGQFLDHDLTLTSTGNEVMLIPVPKGDTYFDPNGTGTVNMRTSRSAFESATGTSAANPREQVNSLSAWIDGSMVYGSDKTTSDALRTFVGGKLKMSSDGMLPLNNAANFPNGTVPQANIGIVPDDQLYAAGDVRANENIELTSLQTLFVREHNRLAGRFARENPRLNDQEIYQRARAMVIAELQAITYNEWLPAVLGNAAPGRYTGYNPNVNPGLSNEFATAAFRFGHSLLGDEIGFLDENGKPIADAVPLSQAFFNPKVLDGKPIDSIFKYLASDPSSELDLKIVGSVRNFLFGAPGSGGFDLASLNIQRGRDHGLADYNDTRASIGMPRVRTFADITKNRDVQEKLRQLYGSVDKIDLWIGLLAEDQLPDASVGPTTAKIIREQFDRIRSADQFWYQRAFSGPLLRELDSTKLSDVLKRNTSMRNIQDNVFLFRSGIEGTVFADTNSDNRRQPRKVGLGNWTVELVDSEGTLVSSVRSLPNGSYRFDVQTGIRTDDYTIRITKDPQGRLLPEPMSRNASITRGDQWVNRVDFGVPPSRPAGRSATSGLNSANSLQAPLVDSVAASSMDQILSEAELRRQSRRR